MIRMPVIGLSLMASLWTIASNSLRLLNIVRRFSGIIHKVEPTSIRMGFLSSLVAADLPVRQGSVDPMIRSGIIRMIPSVQGAVAGVATAGMAQFVQRIAR